jgi:hypothetical protein
MAMVRRDWPTPYQCWLIVWPVVLFWLVLLGFAAYTDTHLPDGRGFDFLTVSLMITVQFLIASVSIRLMKGWEGFTIALAAFLMTKNVYWLWVMAFWLWPDYMAAQMWQATTLRFAIVRHRRHRILDLAATHSHRGHRPGIRR